MRSFIFGQRALGNRTSRTSTAGAFHTDAHLYSGVSRWSLSWSNAVMMDTRRPCAAHELLRLASPDVTVFPDL
ncbi:hypothetical protein EVAR_56038_1 [Eumeta japonica]|uniref:Uncharacterized protein n=1 Tax=Eumeta variegata TaxID=151549 RepID=A0A4C1YAG4_EUMVA|nr:hypothetical protein EVAR_56038_1 [Eumeta japonica]